MKMAAARDVQQRRLLKIGRDLHDLTSTLPDTSAITDTLDYLVGALYAFQRAHELGFSDRPGKQIAEYHSRVAKYAIRFADGGKPHARWEAGFFFNSGIQRLAATFDRLPKILDATEGTAKKRMSEVNPKTCDYWVRVYDEVNAFKHAPGGRAEGRTVSFEDAVAAFEEALTLIRDCAGQIRKRLVT